MSIVIHQTGDRPTWRLLILVCILAVVAVVALVVHLNRGTTQTTVKCHTPTFNFASNPGHWRYSDGGYTDGSLRLILDRPAICKMEAVK